MIFYDLGDMKSGQYVGSTSTAFQDYDYNQHGSDGERFLQNHKRGCHLNSVDDTETGDDSASPPHLLSDVKKQKKSDGNDGSSIEVVRRPRGRPLGSKNKPKPPVVITSESVDSHDVMRPHVLEISSGHDVGDTLARFARRRNVGVSVLAGNGIVSNITLRQPQSNTTSSSYSIPSVANSSSTFTFQGRFEILSISATFFPPAAMSVLPMGVGGMLSVSLAGSHGQIVGGAVAGPLVAAGTVTVIAATFQNPSFHRLPMEDTEISGDEEVGDGGEVLLLQQQPTHHQQQQQCHSGTGLAVGGEPSSCSSGLPMSVSCHLLSDIIWAPMARPPHPPPY
ncbi:AT hook motif DNA-binding family protein [Zostera marina]|uniref:AT hook motif DNA-binding family protein n=1 Tax=Zostera marina TaxID=29655 RepID=A0A0K9PJK6_ZOSMR|nr:AT hook motif DNA-binding family protein [Zostera marina]